MATNKADDAKERIDTFLVANPNNSQALVARSELAAMSGAGVGEMAALLGKAIAANPNDSVPRLLLIDLYLRNKDPKQATAATQNAIAALPDRPELLDALGRVQLEAGDFNQSVATYQKLIKMQPNLPRPYLRLAEVQIAAHDNDAAQVSLRNALEIKPDLLEAQRHMVGFKVTAGKIQDAVAIARTVQKQRPNEVVGFALEGDIHMANKDWNAATGAYRAGLKQAASSELAVKLHSSLVAANNVADADKFASGWRKDHPDDSAFLVHLADVGSYRKE